MSVGRSREDEDEFTWECGGGLGNLLAVNQEISFPFATCVWWIGIPRAVGHFWNPTRAAGT